MNILVALSGGVDSAVAALQLCRQGHRVIGVTMRLWPEWLCCLQSKNACCNLQSVQDARFVAEKLNIPHYILNLAEVFEKEVIKPFCEQYLQGSTPNPCIVCNEKLKFSALLKKAKQLGCNYIATGHYADVYKKDKRWLLGCGKEKKKDQSYVLFSLTQAQLSHSIFPNGKFTKQQVRGLAKKFALPVHSKEESMEICFVPNGKYQDVINHYYPGYSSKGDIVDLSGNIIGSHNGIENFTIGQRKGLRIAKPYPLYVIKIIPEKNIVVAGEVEELYKKELTAGSINWVSIDKPNKTIECKAKIRSTHPLATCRIEQMNDRVMVVFARKQFAVTPGQAVVFYKDNTVLGGGWIERE
jgi:tRNA-specific 2-thiouridylase